jgi:hypothetical protein
MARDRLYTPQQERRVFLCAPADHKSYDHPPDGCESDPDPSVSLSLAQQFRAEQVCFFGMSETPQFIELTFNDMKSPPEVERHQTTLPVGAIQPVTDCVFVNLDDAPSRTNGISSRQSADGQLENSGIGVQFVVCSGLSQSDSPTASFAPGSFFSVTRSVLHQKAFIEGLSIILASAVGAIESFPIHRNPRLGERSRLTRGYEMVWLNAYLIT